MTMTAQSGCWTCRLRRKKCDRSRPVCKACANLEITCYFSDSRPEWMDGGRRQNEMAQCIKVDVKQSAEARRNRQYVQVINFNGDQKAHYHPTAFDDSATATKSGSSGDPDAGNSASASQHTPRSSTETYNGCRTESGGGYSMQRTDVSEAWSILHATAPSKALRDVEIDLTMKYLDYVFPFLFPFYQPSMLEGGRAWLLALLTGNKTLFHAAMSLSSYFFTIILTNAAPGQHETCKQHIWDELASHTAIAIKTMREEMKALDEQGYRATLLQRAHTMESIIQLMVFQAAMARTPDWHIHLAAAMTLFKKIFEEHGMTEGRPDIRKVVLAMDKPCWETSVSDRRVWNTDQASFRFFVAVLLYTDIISSVALRRRPCLQEYHAYLFSTGTFAGDPEFQLQMEHFVGCPSWVLLAISEITTLNTRKKEAMTAGALTPAELEIWGEQVHQSLRAGLARLDTAGRMTDEYNSLNILRMYCRQGGSTQVDEQTTVARIWAHASQIYLTVVVLGWEPQNSLIRQSVATVLSLLQLDSSPATLRNLVWPFCVAGCMADTCQEHDFRNVVSAARKFQAFGSLGEALCILEEVWRRRDHLGTGWDLNACFDILDSCILWV